MNYFYILGNLCSILGFIGLVLQLLGAFNDSTIANWLIIGIIIFTALFWLFFYFKPLNPLAKIINSRIDFTGEYLDSNETQHDIVEGEFNLSTGYVHVPLPPFEEPPQIIILSGKRKDYFPLPQIQDITEDSFLAKANVNKAFGKWKYRAKGKLLKRVINNS